VRLRDFLEPALEVPNPVLADIFATSSVIDTADRAIPVHGNISVAHANALYRTVRDLDPATVLEVGMAYGIATLAIASALHDAASGGQLISIDPNQSRHWRNVGVLNLERAGLDRHHRLIERVDYLALPQLVTDRQTIQFAYIDGWHTFDYTLLDFFYIDRMLTPGGVVAFNDCALPSVHKVLRFVTSHRRYREVDVGLRRRYATRDVPTTLRRLATLRSKSDRYFRKVEAWEPSTDFFARF
jgi:predicted O-methyltransferase YrrM